MTTIRIILKSRNQRPDKCLGFTDICIYIYIFYIRIARFLYVWPNVSRIVKYLSGSKSGADLNCVETRW